MTLKDLFYSVSLLSFGTLCLSACGRFPPPNTELCLIGDSGVLCIDKRLPEDKQEYTVKFKDAVNMICLTPDSYGLLLEWGLKRGKRGAQVSNAIAERVDELYFAKDSKK